MSLPSSWFEVKPDSKQCLVAREAQPARKWEKGKRFEERAPKTDSNGELLWEVDVLAMSEGQAEVIKISVPGDPNVRQGELVRIEGLTLHPWEMDADRSDEKEGTEKRYGISFRATAIRPVNARSQGEKAAA